MTLLMLVGFCTGRRGHHFRRDEGLAVRRALGAVPLHVLKKLEAEMPYLKGALESKERRASAAEKALDAADNA